MEEKNLLPCWKCNYPGMFVDELGRVTKEESKFVSCENRICKVGLKIYTVEEWQNHPRPATREQLVEALRKARKDIAEFSPLFCDERIIESIHNSVKDIDSPLEGEE